MPGDLSSLAVWRHDWGKKLGPCTSYASSLTKIQQQHKIKGHGQMYKLHPRPTKLTHTPAESAMGSHRRVTGPTRASSLQYHTTRVRKLATCP